MSSPRHTRTPHPEKEAGRKVPRCAMRSVSVLYLQRAFEEEGKNWAEMTRGGLVAIPISAVEEVLEQILAQCTVKTCPTCPKLAHAHGVICKGFGEEWVKRAENPP